MNDEEIRIAALEAAVAWFGNCSGDFNPWIPRQLVVETAQRFEDYIRTGK